MAQILKRRWDAAASSTGVELVCKCGDFKVVEPSTVQDSNNDPYLPNMPFNARQHQKVGFGKCAIMCCDFGVVQDIFC